MISGYTTVGRLCESSSVQKEGAVNKLTDRIFTNILPFPFDQVLPGMPLHLKCIWKRGFRCFQIFIHHNVYINVPPTYFTKCDVGDNPKEVLVEALVYSTIISQC